MQITLYTLPTCGICNMVKTKLRQKNISFKEDNFENITNLIYSDRAPALQVKKDNGETKIYNSPTSIVAWINEQ